VKPENYLSNSSTPGPITKMGARAEIAMHILASMINNPHYTKHRDDKRKFAAIAVEWADALVKEMTK